MGSKSVVGVLTVACVVLAALPGGAVIEPEPSVLVTAEEVEPDPNDFFACGYFVRPVADNGRTMVVSGDKDLIAQAGLTDPDPGFPTGYTYVIDPRTGQVEPVNVGPDGTLVQANTQGAAMSADGMRVAFNSETDGYAEGVTDDNGQCDVYLRDLAGDTTTLVTSRHDDPATAADGLSAIIDMTPDGRYALLVSNATDLGPEPLDGEFHLWRFDLETGQRLLVSDFGGPRPIALPSLPPADLMSDDGSVIAYLDAEAGLLFVFEEGVTTHQLPASTAADVAGDGSAVLYTTAQDFPPEDDNDELDAYRFDLTDDQTPIRIASRDGAGSAVGLTEEFARVVELSANGGHAAFTTDEPISDDDGNSDQDLYVYDATADTVSLVSAAPPNGNAAGRMVPDPVTIAPDGSSIVFTSEASQLAGFSAYAGFPIVQDVYVADAADGAITLLTPDSNGAAEPDSHYGTSENGLVPVVDQHAGPQGEGTYAVPFEPLPPVPPATLLVEDVEVMEGNEGTTMVQVMVALDGVVVEPVTVAYATADGSAAAGQDYTAAEGELTLPDTAPQTVAVELSGDTVFEQDETFTVTFTPSEGEPAVVTVTILDDDGDATGEALDRSLNDTTTVVGRTMPSANAATALKFSRLRTPTTAEGFSGATGAVGALLSSDEAFADALSSGVLQAGQSLLLTAPDELYDAVVEELRRLGVQQVTILGGTAAVSQAVEDELAALGFTVQRLSGPTRLETATSIAGQRPEATTAILARAFPGPGGDATQAFADSLAAGAWAAEAGYPVLLTQTEVLSDSTAAYLDGSNITEVFVVGGTAAISDEVLATLEQRGLTVTRIFGPTRFTTAIAIAQARGITAQAPTRRVILAEAQTVDAWAAGFAAAGYAAANRAPVTLTTGEEVVADTVDVLTGPAVPVRDDIADGDPQLVCAADADACLQARSLLGLPEPVEFVLDQNGASVARGAQMSGTVDTGEATITLALEGTCLEDTLTAGEVTGEAPFQLTLGQDTPTGPCDLVFLLAFPNGTIQRQIATITVT